MPNLIHVLKEVLDWLYEAITEQGEDGEYYIDVNHPMYLKMPSGLVVDLSVDFRIPVEALPESVWFVFLWLPNYGWTKIDVSDEYRLGDMNPYITLFRCIRNKLLTNAGIGNWPGSEYCRFYDEDTETTKMGIDFEPTRYYNVFVDGDTDTFYFGIAFMVIVQLKSIGLNKIAQKFIGVFNKFKQRAWKRGIASSFATLNLNDQEILASLSSLVSGSTASSEQIIEILQSIAARVGLRLTL